MLVISNNHLLNLVAFQYFTVLVSQTDTLLTGPDTDLTQDVTQEFKPFHLKLCLVIFATFAIQMALVGVC